MFHSSLLILQPVCEIRISDLLQVADKNARVLPNLYNLPQMGTYFPDDPKTRLKAKTFNLKTSMLTTGPNMQAEETVLRFWNLFFSLHHQSPLRGQVYKCC